MNIINDNADELYGCVLVSTGASIISISITVISQWLLFKLKYPFLVKLWFTAMSCCIVTLGVSCLMLFGEQCGYDQFCLYEEDCSLKISSGDDWMPLFGYECTGMSKGLSRSVLGAVALVVLTVYALWFE